MKEFVEKLIEELEKSKKVLEGEATKEMMVNGHTLDFENLNGGVGAVKCIITLVKHLAEEYKPQLNDNDLMIVESLPSLYPMKEFEEEAIQRVIGCAKKEYNNGWISCSERLPEKDMWCFATFESGNVDKIQYLVTNNWGWNGEMGDNRVIAWMPLPAPYQKGSE